MVRTLPKKKYLYKMGSNITIEAESVSEARKIYRKKYLNNK